MTSDVLLPSEPKASAGGVLSRLRSQHPSEEMFVDRVRRGVTGAFLAFGIITVGLQVDEYSFVNGTSMYVLLGIAACLSATTLLFQWTRRILLTTFLGFSAVASIWLSVPYTADGDYAVSAQWLLHCCAAAGLLLTTRPAAVSVFTTAVAAFLSMAIHTDVDLSWPTVAALLVICIDPVGIAMANNAAFTVWSRSARQRDAAVSRTVEATVNAESRLQVLQRRFAARIRLHDILLSFLRRARAEDADVDEIQADARRCLTELAANSSDAGMVPTAESMSQVDDLAERIGDRCTGLGLRLVLHRDETDDAPAVPLEQLTGIVACADAALLNVLDHARTLNVTTTIVHNEDGLLVRIGDDGIGFSDEEQSPVSVANRARSFGIYANVSSGPGVGTTVEVGWNPRFARPDRGDESSYTDLMNAATTPAIRQILAWTGGAYVLESLISPGFQTLPSLVAIVVLAGVLYWAFSRRNAFPLPTYLLVLVIAVIPFVIGMVSSGYDACSSNSQTFLPSSFAMLAVMTGIMLAKYRYQCVLVIAAYVVTNGYLVVQAFEVSEPCGAAVCANFATDVVTVLVLFALRIYFRRFARDRNILRNIEAAAIARDVAARPASERAAESIQVAFNESTPFIEAIASGAVDIRTPLAQRQMAIESHYLVNVLSITTLTGDLERVLMEAARYARTWQKPLTVNVLANDQVDVAIPPKAVPIVTRMLIEMLTACQESCTITIDPDPEEDPITVVGDARLRFDNQDEPVRVRVTHEPHATWVEMNWSHSRTSH